MITPLNNCSISKENLVLSEQYENQNINNNYFSIRKQEQLSKESIIFIFYEFNFFFYMILFSCFIMCIFAIFIPAAEPEEIAKKYEVIFITIVLSLDILIFTTSKIVLVKDTKKLLIKVMNHLGLPKMKIILKLKNIHFFFRKENDNENKNEERHIDKLFIINHYNLKSIDLDNSTIKQKPAELLYSFSNVMIRKYNKRQIIEVLNDFVGSSRDYKNPLLFDINTYIKDKTKKLDNLQKRKFMKFSRHFFVYYLGYDINDSDYGCFDFFIIAVGVHIDLFLIIPLVMILLNISEEDNRIKITLLFIMIITLVNIILYILYKCLKLKIKDLFRIDCIYSKKFDRIFIGLVNFNKIKYYTFEYQMNNINRFIYEKEENSNKNSFHLKVVFKNNDFQQICTLKDQSENELEGLISLLNKRLIIKTENNFDYNE